MFGVVLIALKIAVVVMIVVVEMIDDTMIEIIAIIGIEVKAGIQNRIEDNLQ